MNIIKMTLYNLWLGAKFILASKVVSFIARMAMFLTVTCIGIPYVWINIPVEYRPQEFWEFFNSILLCYIAWNITINRVGCWLRS